MKTSVVVFDDEERRSDEWARQLRKLDGLADRVVCRDAQKLVEDLRELEHRRRASRQHDRGFRRADTDFDEALVLVVDYDLFRLDSDQVLTGEHVAYLARCYSDCGLIVGVNQDLTDHIFDLTLLDHPRAFTDVSVGSVHLCLPGLWGERRPGFQPWHWPYVLEAAEQYERSVAATAERGLDANVLELLGIDDAHRFLLPRDVASQIQTEGGSRAEPAFATVRTLVSGSPLGLRLKDGQTLDETATFRVAAARLRKWLEYIVLPRQDVLVDAPHLLRRIPALLDEPRKWDAVCVPHRPAEQLGLGDASLAQAQFAWEPWLSRPAWWWPDVAEDEQLDALRDRDDPNPGVVFCEDVSAFHHRDECKSFVSRVGGPFSQRWVRRPSGVEVDYEPAVAFAL